MTRCLESPYVKGNTLTLQVQAFGKNSPPYLGRDVSDVVRVKIVDVMEPSTMSIVVIVELDTASDHDPSASSTLSPTPKMVLKLYDRQFSPQLRGFDDAGMATSESEEHYTTFLHQGSMTQFLEDYDKKGRWAYSKWSPAQLEAYFYIQSSIMHEVEVDVYNHLFDMQGINIPTFYADIQLAPQYTTAGKHLDKSLLKYTQINGVLMEYIAGFPLSSLVEEVPEPEWSDVCNQAVNIINKIIGHEFLNLDVHPRNVLVRRPVMSDGLYELFYIDFASCRFRDPSSSDEVWREHKRRKDEEGAIGYLLTNYISFAKGKKGKKYKGTQSLPWVYRPSKRFEGAEIEICEPFEALLQS